MDSWKLTYYKTAFAERCDREDASFYHSAGRQLISYIDELLAEAQTQDTPAEDCTQDTPSALEEN